MPYNCFDRTWWKPATRPGWPNNREPHAGEKNYEGHPQGVTRREAIEHCQEWSNENAEGPMGLKAEFEEA